MRTTAWQPFLILYQLQRCIGRGDLAFVKINFVRSDLQTNNVTLNNANMGSFRSVGKLNYQC